MPGSSDSNRDEIIGFMKKTEERLSNVSSILEKFGLDLITKIGQQNSKINMLTDKIDELHKATIDVKGLLPQLNKILENQKVVENELELLRSLVQNIKAMPLSPKNIADNIERNDSVTNLKQSIEVKFQGLADKIDTNESKENIKLTLEDIKEFIFQKTGGHRVLYEISQAISKIDSDQTPSPSLSDILKKYLKEKIGFWTNKL